MLRSPPIKKLLFKFAMPTVIAQLINMLYNIVDGTYQYLKSLGIEEI